MALLKLSGYLFVANLQLVRTWFWFWQQFVSVYRLGKIENESLDSDIMAILTRTTHMMLLKNCYWIKNKVGKIKVINRNMLDENQAQFFSSHGISYLLLQYFMAHIYFMFFDLKLLSQIIQVLFAIQSNWWVCDKSFQSKNMK
jgi:hypothetical protein